MILLLMQIFALLNLFRNILFLYFIYLQHYLRKIQNYTFFEVSIASTKFINIIIHVLIIPYVYYLHCMNNLVNMNIRCRNVCPLQFNVLSHFTYLISYYPQLIFSLYFLICYIYIGWHISLPLIRIFIILTFLYYINFTTCDVLMQF